jgi:hypothetical protein
MQPPRRNSINKSTILRREPASQVAMPPETSPADELVVCPISSTTSGVGDPVFRLTQNSYSSIAASDAGGMYPNAP